MRASFRHVSGGSFVLAIAVALLVLSSTAGASPAGGASRPATATASGPRGQLPPFMLKLLRAHAKKGHLASSAAATPAVRARSATARAHDALDPSVAGDLAQAMAATGQSSYFPSASFVTVPSAGTPDAVSPTLTPSLSAPGFPVDGSSFAVLTTGDANAAGTNGGSSVDDSCSPGPDCLDNGDPATKGPGRDAAHDITILQIAVSVPSGMNCLSFDYRYLTSEVPGGIYNDAFVAELDANSWTAPGEASFSPIAAPANFAFDPSHQPISVNAAGTTSLTGPLATGTTYDDATPLLRAATPITAGSHILYLSIFDQGDHLVDSAAFVDDLRLSAAAAGQCSTGSVVSEPPADLSVTQAPAQVVGSQITYAATVHNAGPNPAENVTFSDPLPNGTTFVSVDDADCDSTVFCALGTIAPGASTTITIVVDTSADGTYTNDATVSESAFDPLLGNNEDSVVATVGNPVHTADLGVQIAAPAPPVHQGDFAEYPLLLSNAGPDDAVGGITVTATLPSASLYYQGFDVPAFDTGGYPSSFDGCIQSSSTVTCHFEPGYDQASGSSLEIDLFAYVLGTGTITASASVSADSETTDPISTNNHASASMTALATTEDKGDLSVQERSDSGVVAPSANLVYTITVKNSGPQEVHNADFYNSIFGQPSNPETTDVSVTDTLGECTDATLDHPDPTTFHCVLDLHSGQTDTITYTVAVDGAAPTDGSGYISEFADVFEENYFDPNLANDFWSVFNTIGITGEPLLAADLESQLTTTPTTVAAGGTETSTLKVINHGPSAIDALGFLFLSEVREAPGDATVVSAPGCQPEDDFGDVICDTGTLASGGSKTFTITWTAPAEGGTFFLDSDVASNYPNWSDFNFYNDHKSITFTVTPATADLSMAAAASPGTILSGNTVTYSLTAQNHGPTAAATTQIVDTLPADAVVQSVAGGTCAGATVITCNVGTLAANASATITIVAALSPFSSETAANSATVTSTSFDPDLSNNTSSTSTTVDAAPSITSFSPGHGGVGTSVTILGHAFTGATAVSFGGTAAASLTVDSDTQITATVAAGTANGPVSVTTPVGTASSLTAFFLPPTITGLSLPSGGARATVTITGTNLTGATAVAVGGTPAAFTVVSNTQATFTVPSGAATGSAPVTVTTPGGTSAGAAFTVLPPPTITSISPGSGPIGTSVTITGTNLTGTVGVMLGSVVTVPTSVSATQVVFTIPPGAVTGTITILNAGGSATSVDIFTVTG